MSITSEQLKAILADQQRQFMALLQNIQVGTGQPTQNQSQSNDMDLFCKLSAQISEFVYSPEDNRTFDEWYERFGPFVEHEGKHMPEVSKVRLIVSKLGTDEYRRYTESIQPTTPEKVSLVDTLSKLRSIFPETKSIFIKRYECFLLKCEQNQDVLAFGATVNAMAEKAKMDITKDQIKSLIFVTGLGEHNAELRHRCIRLLDNNAKFEQLLTECKEVIALRQSSAALNGRQEFNSIQIRPPKLQDFSRKSSLRSRSMSQQRQRNTSTSNSSSRGNQTAKTTPQSPCTRCGGRHWNSDCGFPRTVKCYKCGRQGHVSKICRSQGNQSNNFGKSTNIVECLHVTPTGKVDEPNIVVDVQIADQWIPLIADTGSKLTILRKETWRKLGQPRLYYTNLWGRSYTGDIFKFTGKSRTKAALKGEEGLWLEFFVSEKGSLDLLGLSWIRAFERAYNRPVATTLKFDFSTQNVQWISNAECTPNQLKNALQEQFPQVFSEGLGRCTKFEAHLKLKESTNPVFCGSRPVPLGVQQEVDTELDRMIDMGVLKKVDYSRWAAPIVAVRKANGKVRLCFDFSTGLNNALEPHHHPLPRPDQLFAKLSGAKIFSQIDFKDAYLQLCMDDQSRQLLGVNTHRGLYQCQRLAFGIKSAPGIFQWIMDQLASGISGVLGYMDDFIIASKTTTEHLKTIFKFFQRIQEFGFRIQMDKCKFLVKEIKFLGQIVSSDGIKPNPERTRALQQMPPPHDISTLRSFLGAINYYGKFIKDIHQIRLPMDELLKKGVKWEWTDQQQQSFELAKKILLSDLALTHYDPALPIIVTADASNKGIGATVSHRFPDGKEKVFQHAARTLTKTEQAYSQIEKEGLGLIFAIQKFHQYIFGRKFILRTDHRPLLGIFGSKEGIPIFTASRLQRWALTLLNYDFSMEFVRTDCTGQADALSRLISEHRNAAADEDMVIAQLCAEEESAVEQTFTVQADQLPITVEEIKTAQKDDELIRPTQFFNDRRLLVFNGRSVIPPPLRNRILKSLHLSHPGIVRMKNLARTLVYWPSMDSEIEEAVRGCRQCQEAQKQPLKQPLQPWPATTKVFERVHIDLAGPCSDGNTYLVVVDTFSRWPEVFMLRHTSSQMVIDQLQWLFDRFGIPKTLVSDNGPQFTAFNFKNFCARNGINHIFAPPYHPQSNGTAEKFVDFFKRQLKKSNGDKNWLKQSLISYRSTPIAVLNNRSPAELFLGRPLRTKLSLMKPEEFKQIVQGQYQRRMAQQFDKKHGVKRVEFKIGDNVQFANYREGKVNWSFGKIVSKRGLIFGICSPQLTNRIVIRHANAIRLTSAANTDQTWFLNDDENRTIRSPIRSPQVHHQNPATPPVEQNHDQIEPNVQQQQPDQQTPALRRSERATKRVRFLSPNRSGKWHDFRQ